MIHTLPLERRTLHGYFSRELKPVLTIDPGDSVRFSTLDSAWGTGPPPDSRTRGPRFAERDPELDSGHALVGPVEVRGAHAGSTLSVTIDELRVGSYGVTIAGGFPGPMPSRLGLDAEEPYALVWELDADRGSGRDQHGREVTLAPFLGVIGMPPDEPGVHSTRPPRPSGGNLDCKELVVGTTLFLPVPVDGALLSLGDGHARQGDGEVSGLAIECPLETAQVTVGVRDDLPLTAPLARTASAWIAFGIDEDLDEAAEQATAAMLELLEREHGVSGRDALALASVAVDLRVTQIVNLVKGVHAVLPDDAVRFSA